MNSSRWRSSFATAAVAFTVPVALAFLVGRQGFNLLDDGLWLLGTSMIAKGDLLYRDMFSVYGPARYYLLLPFMWGLGESVRTLVVFKATMAGGASLGGFLVARRYGAGRFAWLVPVAVLAFGTIAPRYVLCLVVAVLCAELPRSGSSARARGLILGVAWGALALFGLDMFVSGGVVIAGGWLFARLMPGSGDLRTGPSVQGIAAGLAGVAAITAFVALATGTLGSLVWDTIVCPLAYSPRHVGLNLVDGLLHPGESGAVFAQVFTGEGLGPAWPGHRWQHAAGTRVMLAIVLLAPLVVWPARRLVLDRRVASLAALAATGWVTVIWRADLAHIGAASFGAVIVLACVLGGLATGRPAAAWVVAALVVVAMAPFLGERVWLAAHTGRATLAPWERPAAGILMGTQRRETIERTLEALAGSRSDVTLAWPAQPGLVFLAGKQPASRQVTLLEGSVRDAQRVIAELHEPGANRLVLGRVAGIAPGSRSIEEIEPEIWTYLRSHYSIEHQFADGDEGFQVIRRLEGSGVAARDVPLERRLPGTSQLVKNAESPPLTAGTGIGQVFRVGGIDLHGMALLLVTDGALPVETDLELRFEEMVGGGRTRPLAHFRTRVRLELPAQLCTLGFPVINGSAGRTVVMTVSAGVVPGHGIRLMWHDQRADGDGTVDYYREGYALVAGRREAADLFFMSF